MRQSAESKLPNTLKSVGRDLARSPVGGAMKAMVRSLASLVPTDLQRLARLHWQPRILHFPETPKLMTADHVLITLQPESKPTLKDCCS